MLIDKDVSKVIIVERVIISKVFNKFILFIIYLKWRYIIIFKIVKIEGVYIFLNVFKFFLFICLGDVLGVVCVFFGRFEFLNSFIDF